MGLELGGAPLHGLTLLRLCPPVPGVCPTVNVVPCSFRAVSEPQAAHSPLEKPPSTSILCNTCGNVCKGEVLRVQNKYFHIECFVCKGELLGPLLFFLAGSGGRERSGSFQRGLRRGGGVWDLTWSKEDSGDGRVPGQSRWQGQMGVTTECCCGGGRH